jgi:hypothetical protein
MEVSGDKKSTRIFLNIGHLFFRIVFKLVQELIITYDEFFQALAVEGDILFLKPFVDLTPPIVQPRLGLLGLSRVWQIGKNISKAGNLRLMTPSKTRSSDDFGAGRLLLPPGLGKYHCMLWQVAE